MTPPTNEKDERNETIYWRYMTGDRAADLARAFGLSRERVAQIVRGQWLRRRRLLRARERTYLYSLGLGWIYLVERQQQRQDLLRGRTYRVRPDSLLSVQDWS